MTSDVCCDLCGRPIHRGELAARLMHPEAVACLQHIIPPERLPYTSPPSGLGINVEDRIGMSYKSVSMWELGRRSMTVERLASVCLALGVPVDTMFGPPPATYRPPRPRRRAEVAVPGRGVDRDIVLALAREAEHEALCWDDPLDVPRWVPAVRAALDADGDRCPCAQCQDADERRMRTRRMVAVAG